MLPDGCFLGVHVVQQVILATIITKPIMYARHATAFWTPVLIALSLDKSFDAMVLHEFQILDKTRVIIPSVSRI